MSDRLAMARAAYERLTLYDPQRAPVELDLTDNTNLWGMPPAAERALREMTRANWALHLAGDNGFRRDVLEAASSFEAALRALRTVYAK